MSNRGHLEGGALAAVHMFSTSLIGHAHCYFSSPRSRPASPRIRNISRPVTKVLGIDLMNSIRAVPSRLALQWLPAGSLDDLVGI
jgi:hypothetical protein